MTDVHILAIHLAKRSFQVCTTAPGGAVLFNRMVYFGRASTLYCGDGGMRHEPFWGRLARGLGHDVRLTPPNYAKPFVKRQKNDAADAAAIAEWLA